MITVTILKGIPASGKSTWARQMLDEHPGMYKRINKDDLRAMLDNSYWSKGNEAFVLKVRDILIIEASKGLRSLIKANVPSMSQMIDFGKDVSCWR